MLLFKWNTWRVKIRTRKRILNNEQFDVTTRVEYFSSTFFLSKVFLGLPLSQTLLVTTLSARLCKS